MPIRIRRGTLEDTPNMQHMMMAMASEMGEPNGPQQTLDELIRDAGFHPDEPIAPLYTFFMAEEYHKRKDSSDTNIPPLSIGFAAVTQPMPSKYGRSMLLLNLYVVDQYRTQGIARMLMQETTRFGREHGVVRFQFYCSEVHEAYSFYERIGATNFTQKEGIEWSFTPLFETSNQHG